MPAVKSHSGKLSIMYHQFAIQAGDGSAVDYATAYGAGMLQAKTAVVAVASAFDPADAWVSVEVWEHEPPLLNLANWDASAELSFSFYDDARLAVAFQGPGFGMDDDLKSFTLQQGVYRIRAYGKEAGDVVVDKTDDDLLNDEDYDNDEGSPALKKRLEEILVQFWPELEPAASQYSVLKDHGSYRLSQM